MPGAIIFLIALVQYLNGRYVSSLLLFFLLLCSGFQIIPSSILMAGMTAVKGSDFALVYILIIAWLRRKHLKSILAEYPVFKWCMYLFWFVVVDVFYSYFVLHYSTVNVLQVFRQYIIFLAFIPFMAVPVSDLKKVWHALALITVVQSVLFLAQIATGHTILYSAAGDDNITTNTISGETYIRFYNVPALLIPTLYYFLFVWRFRTTIIQWAVVGILLLTVVGPMHRAVILAIVAVISIYVLLKQSSSAKVFYIAILGIGIYAVSFVDIIDKRIETAFADIQQTFATKLDVNNIDINENSALFRVGHLLERFNYVAVQPQRWVFGIGLISDHAPYAAQLPFQFGLKDEVTGEVVQIDTSDLSWSPLILTIGFVGTLIFVWLMLKFIVAFYKNISNDTYCIAGFLTILTAILLSMAGAELLEYTFRGCILLLASIGLRKQEYTLQAQSG